MSFPITVCSSAITSALVCCRARLRYCVGMVAKVDTSRPACKQMQGYGERQGHAGAVGHALDCAHRPMNHERELDFYCS